jgi:hypothetical protein
MPALARLQPSNCSNPELDLFTQVNGMMTDVYSLEFQIFELVTDPNAPVQVYPVTPGDRATVDIANLCADGGHKISTGHYVAAWTPPVDELIGRHHIKWFFKLQVTSPEQSYTEEFMVMQEVAGFSSVGYCTVQELRDEGVTTNQADDARLEKLITRWTAYIESVCGRYFDPRTKTLFIDGRGRRILHVEEPIIEITEVAIVDSADPPNESIIDPTSYRVYNRHMSGLMTPDDRDDPRIEMIHGGSDVYGVPEAFFSGVEFTDLSWPIGTQNVRVKGTFGYTDPDGTQYGRTPELIKLACMMLVVRGVVPVGQYDKSQTRLGAWRLIKERTRDQEVGYAPLTGRGVLTPRYAGLTGDPEIDNILLEYMRPHQIRAA